jgi:hypothetical protein
MVECYRLTGKWGETARLIYGNQVPQWLQRRADTAKKNSCLWLEAQCAEEDIIYGDLATHQGAWEAWGLRPSLCRH